MQLPTRKPLTIALILLGCVIVGLGLGNFLVWVTNVGEKELRLTVCTTTDLHGAYFEENYDGSHNPSSLARVSTALQELRAQGENPILIDVGDNLQGDNAAYYYNYVDTVSEHVFATMARDLNYDAIIVGNHDIEAGHPVYDRLKESHKAPLLAANAVISEGSQAGQPYFTPYTIVRREGLDIAIIGMTNANIKAWLTEEKWKGIDFRQISVVAQSWVDRVRKKERPALVILAVHSGVGKGDWPDIENEGLWLARKLKGVDLVLCGHDHRPRTELITHRDGSETFLIDAGSKALMLGVAQFSLTKKWSHLKAHTCEVRLEDLRDVEPDEAFVERYAPQFEAVRAYALRPVGKLTKPLSFEDALQGPSAYMSLIHRAQLYYSQADVSISAPLASQGFLPAGPVSFLDLTRIYKFENLLYTVELTGAQLKGYLEYSYDHWVRRDGPSYNYDSAAGIRYTVNRSADYGHRVRILSMENGRPFNPQATYRVAMTSYRASGAGNLLSEGAGVNPDSLKITAMYKDIRSLIGDYLSQSGPYTPTADANWAFIR